MLGVGEGGKDKIPLVEEEGELGQLQRGGLGQGGLLKRKNMREAF